MKMGFISGIIAGALVGSAVTMVMDPVSDRDRRKLYRNTKNAFRTISSLVDTLKR